MYHPCGARFARPIIIVMCKTIQIHLVRGEETCGGGLSVCDGRALEKSHQTRGAEGGEPLLAT